MEDFTMFDALDTAYLKRAKKDLMHALPGDGTFLATVGLLLRAQIDETLAKRPDAQPTTPFRVPVDESTQPVDIMPAPELPVVDYPTT